MYFHGNFSKKRGNAPTRAPQRSGRNTQLAALLAYLFLALAAMYATWPYLWSNPIGHLVESIEEMAKYPWQGQVLFDGALYASTELPRSYLPVLLGIQLTEPVWALFFVGLAGTAWKSRENRDLLLLTLIWFILPALGFIAARAEQYDYIVSTSRYNLDQTSYPEAQIVHEIDRDGAVLTVIKQP